MKQPPGAKSTEGPAANTYVPGWGWPLRVPKTNKHAYIGGSAALNIPTQIDDDDGGDWHETGTWWIACGDRPHESIGKVELWGPQGSIEGAPGPVEVRDVREALDSIGHPCGRDSEPVYAATIVQATLDLAWQALEKGHEPPDRRATFRWMSDNGEAHAQARAAEIAQHITDPERRSRSRRWADDALGAEDPFYESRPTRREWPAKTGRIRIKFRAE